MQALFAVFALLAGVTAASAQKAPVDAITATVQATTFGAACGLRVDMDRAKKGLGDAGFDPSNRDHQEQMDRISNWARLSVDVVGLMSASDKEARCARVLVEFGPQGIVRPGLVSRP